MTKREERIERETESFSKREHAVDVILAAAGYCAAAADEDGTYHVMGLVGHDLVALPEGIDQLKTFARGIERGLNPAEAFGLVFEEIECEKALIEQVREAGYDIVLPGHGCKIASKGGSDSILVQHATDCGESYNWFYPLGEPVTCTNIAVRIR